MFQLSNLNPLMGILSAICLCACSHSTPNIHGGNSDPVRVKVIVPYGSSSQNSSDSYSGTIEAAGSTTPSFSVAGTITAINVTEGQHVSKGQLIATVDGSSLRNSYEIAQATLAEAQDAYNRLKKLHEANALPDMQWVAVQEKLKQAEAAANIARTAMNDANLYAPVNGVVSRKLADVGQTVAPGIPIVELMDITNLKAKISVPEQELSKLVTGAPAVITAGDRSYNASLSDKSVTANTLSRNYDVKFKITDPDKSILPGMICSVMVENSTAHADSTSFASIILPPSAIVLSWDNNSYVWVKKDGLAQRKAVKVAGLDSRGILIESGINSTDSVIVEGQQKLSTGLQVTAI